MSNPNSRSLNPDKYPQAKLLSFTESTYAKLDALLDHYSRPYQRMTFAGGYTGQGTVSSEYRKGESFKGIGNYLNSFAGLNHHPSTFAPDLTQMYQPMPEPWTGPSTYPDGTTHYPDDMDSPYYLSYWHPYWADTSGDTYQRRITITDSSIAYFYRVAVWWRIPPRAYAVRYETHPNAKTPSQYYVKGREVQMATACIEALAIGTLTHPDWVPVPKHASTADYQRQRKLNYDPNIGDGTLTSTATRPTGPISTLAAALRQDHITRIHADPTHPLNPVLMQLGLDLVVNPEHVISIQRAARKIDTSNNETYGPSGPDRDTAIFGTTWLESEVGKHEQRCVDALTALLAANTVTERA